MKTEIPGADQVRWALGDPERLAALHRSGLLDTPAEDSFDRLASLAARILKAPMSLVTLVDQDRQYFKSAIGLGEPWATRRELPLSLSFCHYVVANADAVVVGDARRHPLLADSQIVAELGAVAYAGMPLRTREGHVLGSFCVIDRQPRDWTESELSILRDLATSVTSEIELRAADRQREEFLALMAHELRNPIAAIDALAAGLGRSGNEPDRHAALLALRRQSYTLRAVAEDLLAIGRVEAGRLELQPAPVDLGEIVADVIASCPEPARVQADLSTVPIVIEVDPVRVGQMVDNLVRNALKYSAPGVTVDVMVRRERHGARVVVRDHGVGLASRELGMLFRKYGRIHNERTAAAEGIGLGLYLTRLLAEAHGATVSASSEGAGHGSTFFIDFPDARS